MHLRWFFTLLTTDSHSPPKWDLSGTYSHSILWQLQIQKWLPVWLDSKGRCWTLSAPGSHPQSLYHSHSKSVMDIPLWQQIDVRQWWRLQMFGQIVTEGEPPLLLDMQIGRCRLSELLVSLHGHSWFETGQHSQHQHCEILRLEILCLRSDSVVLTGNTLPCDRSYCPSKTNNVKSSMQGKQQQGWSSMDQM